MIVIAVCGVLLLVAILAVTCITMFWRPRVLRGTGHRCPRFTTQSKPFLVVLACFNTLATIMLVICVAYLIATLFALVGAVACEYGAKFGADKIQPIWTDVTRIYNITMDYVMKLGGGWGHWVCVRGWAGQEVGRQGVAKARPALGPLPSPLLLPLLLRLCPCSQALLQLPTAAPNCCSQLHIARMHIPYRTFPNAALLTAHTQVRSHLCATRSRS